MPRLSVAAFPFAHPENARLAKTSTPCLLPPSRHHPTAAFHLPLTIRSSRGIIAGWPLCCQQRSVPRTRRWHGVPFFVSAPQIETISDEEAGGRACVTLPSGSPLVCAGTFSIFERVGAGTSGAVCVAATVGSRRSKMRGGVAGRTARPAPRPSVKKLVPATRGKMIRAVRKRGAQAEQKRRLVQRCQRERAIRSPHSVQKFGLYILRVSVERRGNSPLQNACSRDSRRAPCLTRKHSEGLRTWRIIADSRWADSTTFVARAIQVARITQAVL
jgi:hypothetical protein